MTSGTVPSVVYFAERSDGAVKIGYTTDLPGRMKTLQTGAGPLKVLLTVPGGAKEEQRYHEQLKDHRLHGEWFSGDSVRTLVIEPHEYREWEMRAICFMYEQRRNHELIVLLLRKLDFPRGAWRDHLSAIAEIIDDLEGTGEFDVIGPNLLDHYAHAATLEDVPPLVTPPRPPAGQSDAEVVAVVTAWDNWTLKPEGTRMPRPGEAGVASALAAFRTRAGYEVSMVLEAIPKAMTKATVVHADKWRYMCGIVWRGLDDA